MIETINSSTWLETQEIIQIRDFISNNGVFDLWRFKNLSEEKQLFAIAQTFGVDITLLQECAWNTNPVQHFMKTRHLFTPSVPAIQALCFLEKVREARGVMIYTIFFQELSLHAKLRKIQLDNSTAVAGVLG